MLAQHRHEAFSRYFYFLTVVPESNGRAQASTKANCCFARRNWVNQEFKFLGEMAAQSKRPVSPPLWVMPSGSIPPY